jgi:AraC family transcriptional regulator
MVMPSKMLQPNHEPGREPGTPEANALAPADSVAVVLSCDSPGEVEVAASPGPRVAIHTGPPAYVVCRRGGEHHGGTAIHGDIDVVPAGMTSCWQIKDPDIALVLHVNPGFLREVAQQSDVDVDCVEIRNRFQIRDLQIEHIGLALQLEMDHGYPCGRLYRDGLAAALVAQLLRNHSSLSRQPVRSTGGLSASDLKQVLAFIEENLSEDLSLRDLARVVDLSISHFQALFRESVGLSVHQYVIRRRIERAVVLLREGKLSITQITLETGFAHPSHLALQMRRIMGFSPKAFRGALR